MRDYGSPFVPITERSDDYVSTVTVAFNSFFFSQPICEGDLILVDSRVVSAGSSSIGIHVRVQRQAYDCPAPSVVGESFVTFVTIQGKQLTTKVVGKVPAVRLTSDLDKRRYKHYLDIRRQARALEARGEQALQHAPSGWTPEAVEMEENQTKAVKVPLASTKTVANRTFWLDDLNTNHVIFGGALLHFMEEAALHCGRVFAQESHMYTLGMLSMTFDEPVHLTDLPCCTCQVVCVRRSTMLVNVQVVSGRGKTLRGTNKASFILVHTGDDHRCAPIKKGIDLSGATPEELRLYWKGRTQLEDALNNRRSYHNNVMT
ncbi:ATP-binding protein Cassette (ABC) superfamily [Strigomonas culicis]|uniref:ATP-binding protein Cassette (ABC) superfamily n=1 Tax=Strigomonas culicis TaxID=28005 RepID=S9TJN0_9TRYP|nr:ATP-binding protein Cassette (ABC) superfamily [Strigomonas culicis]|eukprot:EPY16558.1 ATP-binding protein Cassette (ABC) superfamily [Strigomonas culicis]